MVDTKGLIAYTTGEYGRRADFHDYLSQLKRPDNWLIAPVYDRSPAKGRNIIFELALEHHCTHVLIIDDDMAPRPDALMRLLAHDKDVISGLYLSRAYPHTPMVFDLADEEGKCLPIYLEDDVRGLKKIVAAGFGFLLINTAILHKMEKPWVRLGELDSQEWCDDIGFFNRLRRVTSDIYCDVDVKVGHMGTMIVWPQYEKGRWLTGYDTGGKGMISTPQISSSVTYGTNV